MIIIRRRCPAFWNEEAWSKNFLTAERPNLQPYPSDEDVCHNPVIAEEQNVMGHGIKVHDGRKSKDALSDDEVPA